MIAAPVITSVAPVTGGDGGGDTVVITGTGLSSVSEVRFGNVPAASFTVDSDTTIHALTPQAAVDSLSVPVIVTGPGGTSVVTDACSFVYLALRGRWTRLHTIALFGILVAIGVVARALPDPASGIPLAAARPISWLLVLLLLVGFMMIAGQGITDRWAGLLIDERNRMSLSRVQLISWTVLIVSALVCIALANIAQGTPAPLSIGIPGQIWTVLGISTASLIGSPLLLSPKTAQTPDPIDLQQTQGNVQQKEGLPSGSVSNTGLLLTKARPADARWADLFKGEETGNGDYLDASRVQMFFFTFVLVLAYGVAIFALLQSSAPAINAFPPFDASMVALLAISHAGYLTNKVIPHSQTT